MTLLYDRIILEEIGYMPDGTEDFGLLQTWGHSEALRPIQAMRIGVVMFTGVKCVEVSLGMTVAFKINQTVRIDLDGQIVLQIREEDIQGVLADFDVESFKEKTRGELNKDLAGIVIKRDDASEQRGIGYQ